MCPVFVMFFCVEFLNPIVVTYSLSSFMLLICLSVLCFCLLETSVYLSIHKLCSFNLYFTPCTYATIFIFWILPTVFWLLVFVMCLCVTSVFGHQVTAEPEGGAAGTANEAGDFGFDPLSEGGQAQVYAREDIPQQTLDDYPNDVRFTAPTLLLVGVFPCCSHFATDNQLLW